MKKFKSYGQARGWIKYLVVTTTIVANTERVVRHLSTQSRKTLSCDERLQTRQRSLEHLHKQLRLSEVMVDLEVAQAFKMVSEDILLRNTLSVSVVLVGAGGSRAEG